MKALRWADKALFGFGSPAAICLLRVLIGALTTISVGQLLMEHRRWFTEAGFSPIEASQLWQAPLQFRFIAFGQAVDTGLWFPQIDLLRTVTDPRVSFAFHVLVLIVAGMATLGIWTRFSTIAMFIGLASLHTRSPMILQGGDTALRTLAFYLALAPSGLMYSIDSMRRSGPVPQISLWPQRLMAWNCALVYLTTVALKLGSNFGNTWKDGTATWYTARLDEFQRFPVPKFMGEFPMVRYTTYGTLAAEIALGTLVFYKPTRKWALLSGVLLHAYIEYSMNVPLFSWIMVSWYVVFYRGEEVEECLKRWIPAPQQAPV